MKGMLHDCAKIERLAADIYQVLSRQTTFRKEVRETFAKLAQDEYEHAAHIDMVMQMPEESLGMVKRISGARVAEGQELITQASRDIQRHAASEEAALRMAIELENKFVKMHLDNVIHFHVPKVKEMFEDLGRGDEAHVGTLKDCLDWWHAEGKKNQSPA